MNHQINEKTRYFIKIIGMALLIPFFLSPPAFTKESFNRRTPVVLAVERVSPAVVNISSEIRLKKRTSPFKGMDPFFDTFYKDFFDPRFQGDDTRTSLGSGVIIDGFRGLILTNAHVIEKTAVIQVVLKNEKRFEAQIVGVDQESDLAVLKIESTKELPAIDMGNSGDIMIGETVIAIGNPFGFSNTVTTGVVSAKNRSIKTDDQIFHDFLQIDASINPGNSGGPLLNINGELIGINTAIYAKAQGIGFAIPINKAKRIVSDLIQYGEVLHAWVGLNVQPVSLRKKRYLNIPRHIGGVMITSVEPQSPSLKVGIKESDIVLKLNRMPVHSVDDYHTILKGITAGDTVEVILYRDQKKYRYSIKTSLYPDALAPFLTYRLLGIKVKNTLSKIQKKNQFKPNSGVMISDIDDSAYLFKIGVKRGDMIHRIDNISVQDISEFYSALIKCRLKKSIVILLQRFDQLYSITVKLNT